MQVEVVMPKMGESLQEGTIINWMKKEGDTIERDEMILEISTDKVDTEVPSPQSGVLLKILVPEETTVEVGTPIAIIETDANAAGSASKQETSAPEPVQQSQPEPVQQSQPEPTPQEKPEPEPAQEQAASSSSGGNTVDVVMPKMGESLQEGTIIKWLKQVGDKIERDEMILEISTDKVDTEVPSPVSGTLTEILVQEEETVEVGTPIARISSGSGSASVAKSAPAPQQSAPAPQSASAPQPQPQASQPSSAPQQQVTGTTFEIPRTKDGKFFSPLVREIAKDKKVSLEELMTINGSGIEGRITKDDLIKYIDSKGSKPQAQAPAQQTSQAQQQSAPSSQSSQASQQSSATKQQVTQTTPPSYAGKNVEVIPMDRMRKLISEHMVMSKRTSAHVTSVAEVDVTELVKYREKHKAAFEKREGIKLTYTSFFLSAVAEAVRQNPMINVSVDGTNILRHRNTNIGMATALPDGNLIVPVIKNADGLSLTGLQRSVYDLADRARNKKLDPDDVMGGTITMTNVGTFGTLFGTPVINQPQCVIFGVGAIKKQAVVRELNGDDAIVVRHIMYMSITYDHRVIDGMLGGKSLKAAVDYLESLNENTIQL